MRWRRRRWRDAAAEEALHRLAGAARTSAATETEALFGALMDGAGQRADEGRAAGRPAHEGRGAVREIAGAAAAMRRRAMPHPPHRRGRSSTPAAPAATAAALSTSPPPRRSSPPPAACTVAKHGNRSVSSRSGSADVLAALGVDDRVAPEISARALDAIGIAFLFAPRPPPGDARGDAGAPRARRAHHLQRPRAADQPGRRPAPGDGRLRRELVELIAARARATSAPSTPWSSTAPTASTRSPPPARLQWRGARRRGRGLRRWTPRTSGCRRAALADLAGGYAGGQRRRACGRVCSAGEAGPLADVTALNAGAALYVGRRWRATSRDGVTAGRASVLASGAGGAQAGAARGLSRPAASGHTDEG